MKQETDKLVVENLYKIFGPQPEQAFELLESGKSKAEILEQTGLTVGVQNTSFAVKPGEIFVVMGLSGSGKSTLVRMLNRLIEPTRGEVSVDGENITQCDMKAVRDIRLRKMAMVFQHFALFPHMTVVDNAAYGLRVQGVKRKERRDTAMQALAQVGLEAWAKRSPNALSGGMQQRVGLARGLAVSPDILLMDEPFSALDPLIRHDMQLELLELQRNVQQTIVFITHDLNEALILGDRIAIMKDGQFVQVGTAQDIVSDPADDYVAAFTKDIDRGRVFTAEYVMVEPAPLDLDTDTPQTAMDRMNALDRSGLYTMRGDGIRGVVTYRDAADHAARQENDLSAIVQAKYPTVTTGTYLYQVYEQCSHGLPLAVLDDDGALQGAVEPIRVFSQLCADDEQQADSGAVDASTDKNAPATVTETQQ